MHLVGNKKQSLTDKLSVCHKEILIHLIIEYLKIYIQGHIRTNYIIKNLRK